MASSSSRVFPLLRNFGTPLATINSIPVPSPPFHNPSLRVPSRPVPTVPLPHYPSLPFLPIIPFPSSSPNPSPTRTPPTPFPPLPFNLPLLSSSLSSVSSSPCLLLQQRRHFSHEKKRYSRAHEFGNETHSKREELSHNKDKHRLDEQDTVMEFSVIPVGTSHSDTSLSAAVEVCARVARKFGLRHEVHAMGLVIEGTLDQCYQVASQSVLGILKRAPRVVLNVQADIRPGHENRLSKKMKKIMLVEPVPPTSGH